MADRACKTCGTDISHLHHFNKYCEEHSPKKAEPKQDVSEEERAAFKATQGKPSGESIAQKRIREIREERKHKRVNIGGFNLKMEAKLPPGMKGRWVNDVNGRIGYLESRGYTAVSEDMEGVVANNTGTGKNITQVVGTKEGGGEMTAHLMMIPEEIFEEDQAIKRKELDKVDEALNRGQQPDSGGHDMSNQYAHVNITHD